MLKRSLSLLAMLLVMVPMMAFAGSVSMRVMTAGGSISVNGGAPQTFTAGTVTKSYSAAATVAITPNPGYKISGVTLSGAAQPLSSPLLVPFKTTSQTVSVSFARLMTSVTATATTNDGTVSPYGTTSLYAATTATYTFSPALGKKVESITVDGVALPAPGYTLDKVLPSSTTVKLSFTVPSTGPVNIVGAFVPLSVSAGAPQTALLNGATAKATLAGSTSATAQVVWSQVSGPAPASFSATNILDPEVTFPATGTYSLKLSANNGAAVATTTVTVAATAADAALVQCVNCHNSMSPAVGATVFESYRNSAHAEKVVLCARCHTGADTGAHPGPAPSTIKCENCHSAPQPNHVAVTGCFNCHNAHNLQTGLPHSNYTSSVGNPNYRASYVTPRTECTFCHFPAGQTDTLTAIRKEWSESAHGDINGLAWKNSASHDWKNSDACVRCHTAVGFVAYSSLKNANKLNVTDKECEPLTCNACHTDVTTGELRSWSYPLNMPASNGATLAYDVPGSSALCVRCHGGRESGDSIKNSTGDFTNLSLINSHYLAAGGVVYNKSGYEYAGQSYDSLGYHKNVGKNSAFETGTSGPCVACHMSANNGHTWEFVAKDSSGHITANNSTVCVNCHDGLTGAALEAVKEEYDAALAALKTALAAKGIFYDNLYYPYFFKDSNSNGALDASEKVSANAFKNWDSVYPGKGKDVMGAAFNLNLLVREPGAWAHNKQYALKLIADSCDLIADGAVDGAGIPAAVTTAQNSEAFAQATGHPARIVTESTATNCAACHVPAPHYGGTAFLKAQYVSAASLPVSCADCHTASLNTTANQAILSQFADSAHGDTAAEAWIHYDWRTANRSSCARCHTGTAFVAKLGKENDVTNVFQSGDVLKPGEALTCAACHANAGTGELRTAAEQFTINLKNGATVTYNVAGASSLCARCHSGRETGASIKADTDTTGVRGFIESHYQPVAGTLYNKAGYEYAGQSYDLGSHKLLGATSQGPCVSCHMQEKNHTFAAAACGACHDGVKAPAIDAATVKANYEAALNNLKLALEAKGIYYGPVHPFFYTAPYAAGSPNTPFTNWAGVYGAASWKDTMGAAFNYNLLVSDKGAYAHNYNYAMKLIADSINFMSNGGVGGQ